MHAWDMQNSRCLITGYLYKLDWLTVWLYLHNQTLQINSEIANYNVQDRKEWTHTDSCPKDKYKFKLRITNNTNTKKITERLENH